jgi:large subunit ribosomal protein L23
MILFAPIKTEKAISKIEYENTLTFQVDIAASKKQITDEVETLFKVKVATVRTQITSRGKKTAYVKLAKEFKADDVAVKLKMLA